MKYDESTLLMDYVWEHGRNYMSEFECRAKRTVLARQKAEYSSASMARRIRQKWMDDDIAEVAELLKEGETVFRQRLAQRIVKAHPEFVNRCPACNRLARTPKAKQCRWCGEDWH